MASKQMRVFVVAAALAVAFLPALAVATEHTVGDDKGWVLGFDYAAWAETKQFKVGDTLVFRYKSPNHTVVEVGGADFKTCTKPETATGWSSGEDRVTLDNAGRRWFFCGVGEHCKRNMKLKITVLADDAGPTAGPAPGAPSTTPPPASSPAGKVQARIAQVVTAVIAAVLVF